MKIKTTGEPTKPSKPKSLYKARTSQTSGSCSLSCLSESSRLVAFGEIASEMPDSDPEDDEREIVPGSSQDWRTYTWRWCQCDEIPPLTASHTDPLELEQALLPNTVSKGTRSDPAGLSDAVHA